MKKGLRIAASLGVVSAACGLGATAPGVLPRALDAAAWLQAADDPEQLTALGLRQTLTGDVLASELGRALDADDATLAESFIELAGQQGMAVPTDLQTRFEAATGAGASVRRGARDFYAGLVGGDGATGAGLAGVVAGDLTGVSDVRDLIRESQKMSRGEEPDHLTLGLAAVGLALTGATMVTVGMALPARAGVSTMRVAARSGRLSKPLAAEITRIATDAFDQKAVAAAAAAATRLEMTSARTALANAVRPASLARLRGMAEDVSTIGRRAGVRGAQEALAISTDAADLRRVARLSESRGLSTRAVLKVLGRGAIALSSGAAILAGWVMAGVGYVWAALLIALTLVRGLARVSFGGGRLFVKLARLPFRYRQRSHAPR